MTTHAAWAGGCEERMRNAQRIAFATVIATVVLIAIGATVRATGSGLGCPDWPTCHGGVVPPAGKHTLIEFSHRFAGMVVGEINFGKKRINFIIKSYQQCCFFIYAGITVYMQPEIFRRTEYVLSKSVDIIFYSG